LNILLNGAYNDKSAALVLKKKYLLLLLSVANGANWLYYFYFAMQLS